MGSRSVRNDVRLLRSIALKGIAPGTYSVFSLGCRATLFLVGVLNGDSLLAVDRLAGDEVSRRKKILLAATGNEDALVTMGLLRNG